MVRRIRELSRRIAHFGGCRQRLRYFDRSSQSASAGGHTLVEGNERSVGTLSDRDMQRVGSAQRQVKSAQEARGKSHVSSADFDALRELGEPTIEIGEVLARFC